MEGLPDVPNWMLTGGGLGGFFLLAYWFLAYLKEERKERQEIEAKREAARLAHDAKRDETLKSMADQCHAHSEKLTAAFQMASEKQGLRMDENTKAWGVASEIMERYRNDHGHDSRPRTA